MSKYHIKQMKQKHNTYLEIILKKQNNDVMKWFESHHLFEKQIVEV